MLNHVRSWLFVDRLSKPVVVLDRLPGLYGLKYDSVTVCGLALYLCSYKLVGSATKSATSNLMNSIQKGGGVPNITGSGICPSGMAALPGTIP